MESKNFPFGRQLEKEYDLAIILVSHDFNLVKEFADKVILLDHTIVKEGTPDEVFSSHEFQERFED